MKKNIKHLFAALFVLAVVTTSIKCTQTNQVINPPSTASTILNSVKGTPTFMAQGEHMVWNGDITGWTSAPKLTVLATVPNPGNGIFTGFNGNSDSVSIQSMYDATNIYMLIQWKADQQNCASSPWYYNPTPTNGSYWFQEAGTATPAGTGTQVIPFRPPFVQDEFVIMFNINNSTRNFNSLSCYVACHTYSNYGVVDTPIGGAMWTNGPTEFLDCWRARTLQVLNENQANDTYIWNGGGSLNKQEVTADPTALPSVSNKQSLKPAGRTTSVSVPKYVYKNGTYQIYPNLANGPFGAMFASDTAASLGKTLKVTAVDTFGVLTLMDGSKIDPRTGNDSLNYRQIGYNDGLYCIPGSILFPYTGGQSDVTANYFWTGNGWELLLARKLTTADCATVPAHDIDFSSLTDQPFGMGVMFNGADNQHAIVTGLTLHFTK